MTRPMEAENASIERWKEMNRKDGQKMGEGKRVEGDKANRTCLYIGQGFSNSADSEATKK